MSFQRWLHKAHPGNQHIYFMGNLAEARTHIAQADTAAQRAWDAYEAGLVYLFQKRISPMHSAYIAVRTREPYNKTSPIT